MQKKIIGITLGDPAGIGPEVIAKALSDSRLRGLGDFKIIGDAGIYHTYNTKNYKNCEIIDTGILSRQQIKIGKSTPLYGKASFLYLKKAIELLKKGEITSLVTGPVSKESIAAALGKNFHGHTELLADAFDIKNFEMLFIIPPTRMTKALRVILVTRHIPLQNVIKRITKEKVLQTIKSGNTALKKTFKIKNPKIAVCGLNPHAGEGGKIGNQEITEIIPAVKKAREAGIHVKGPFPADTLFSPGIVDKFDLVLAMYHDQGLIPIKTLCFNKLVNTTIGLPFIRTSPAHGTAFNIAGKNIADPGSMKEAIKLAATL